MERTFLQDGLDEVAERRRGCDACDAPIRPGYGLDAEEDGGRCREKDERQELGQARHQVFSIATL